MKQVLSAFVAVTMFALVFQVQAGAATTSGSEGGAGETVGTATLHNLQIAYYAESNAAAAYQRYAAKADSEGYGQVASLFRAVSRGEQVHAERCAKLIREMGGTPKVNSEPIFVQSTKENLLAADAEQNYESDVMYPEYIEQARRDKHAQVAEVFTQNEGAEPAHHALFQQALSDLEAYKGENVAFYVCSACGNVARTLNETACPLCAGPREKFEEIR